jgi:hypothetical protein
MTTQLERDLVRTLETAAGRSPIPPADLVAQVDRRHRRRRQRSRAAIAATVAVCALATGSTWGLGVLPHSGSDATLQPSRDRPAKAYPTAPVEELWPQAVHDIGNRLPNGKKFVPRTFVDEHTVLVSVQAGFERAGELWVYDISAGTAHKVTTIVSTDDTTIFASGFTIGDGHVAWWTSRENEDGESEDELWTAPLTGGQAHLAVRLSPEHSLNGLALADGHVYWSVAGGGVYRAPRGGGTELVDGTDGFAIVAWPWIGSPGPRSSDQGDTVRSWPTTKDEVTYQRLRNLETGEERDATDRDGQWVCLTTWCLGIDDDMRSIGQRRDGTGRHTLPAATEVMWPVELSMAAMTDRFVVMKVGASPAIYDLETRRAGKMARSVEPGTRLMADSRLYYSMTKNGYQLLDLAAVARSK